MVRRERPGGEKSAKSGLRAGAYSRPATTVNNYSGNRSAGRYGFSPGTSGPKGHHVRLVPRADRGRGRSGRPADDRRRRQDVRRRLGLGHVHGQGPGTAPAGELSLPNAEGVAPRLVGTKRGMGELCEVSDQAREGKQSRRGGGGIAVDEDVERLGLSEGEPKPADPGPKVTVAARPGSLRTSFIRRSRAATSSLLSCPARTWLVPPTKTAPFSSRAKRRGSAAATWSPGNGEIASSVTTASLTSPAWARRRGQDAGR